MTYMKPDDVQAEYWQGLITRREIQPVLDQISGVVRELISSVHGTETQEGLITVIAKLDATLAFVMDRMGVTPGEFQAYLVDKTKEFITAQEAARATAEAPAPMVTLE